MNTFLSSAQEAIREKYLAFASETVAPIVKGLESHEVCLKEFLQDLGQKGYLGISVPTEYGGQGNPFTFSCLFTEILGMHEPGLGLSLAGHYAAIEVLKKYGSDKQKSRYLPLLSRGELLATLAFSEETAGTDFKAVLAQLTKDGDSYLLNAKKSWVVNGEICGLALVLSKNLENSADPLAVAIVDLTEKSYVCSTDIRRMGLRSAYANNIEFKNQRLSADNLIQSAAAEKIALFAMDIAKLVLAASSVGLSFSALNLAVTHARSREQFGATIGQFQGIQWKLADICTEAEGARMQVLRAAWSLEAEPEKFSTYASMSKWFAARVARQQSAEAMQVLGASGLLEDCPMEKLYRDAKAMEICFGTSEAQKLQLVDLLEI
ncbi:MAG: acyl-CoA dehydrogenase family protein [Candidatus Obscuribacterales bacterium]|nr:acyl-CoA dehydrogenase family protein [Candidatus Obscuribacterales bacterium]